MTKKHIQITRVTQYRIEIHDKSIFNKAMQEYWKERNVFHRSSKFFLRHLALLAEQGFIKDEMTKFGVIVRIESSDCKIKNLK